MIQNNIDLSLKVFNSDLKFIVNDDEIKIVLNKDLKVGLDFNTLNNTITLKRPIEDIDEVKEDVDKDTIITKAHKVVAKAKELELVGKLNETTLEDDIVEDNTYIEPKEDPKEEPKENNVSLVRPPDIKIEEPDTYWENGILKHREVKDVSVENTESSDLEDPNTENRFN